MATLYLRNVPDDVVERLQRLADRDGTSLGAVAVRELAAVSRRADNAALLGALPDLAIDPAELVSDLDAGRTTEVVPKFVELRWRPVVDQAALTSSS